MGRPLKLTSEIHDEVILRLASGAYLDEIAGYVPVSANTLRSWKRRGDELLALIEAGEDEDLTADDVALADFARGCDRARSQIVVRAHTKIAEAMDKHWQAAAWVLERGEPSRYGRIWRDDKRGKDDVDEPDEEVRESIRDAARQFAERRRRQEERRAAGGAAS